MAVISDLSSFAAPNIKIGPKAARMIFYAVIGVVAMGIAVPAAIATADTGIFEECFAAAEVCAAQ